MISNSLANLWRRFHLINHDLSTQGLSLDICFTPKHSRVTIEIMSILLKRGRFVNRKI